LTSPGADTHLLLAAFVDELVRCGMTDACTSPGSRCTPIVLALAREPGLRAHSHIDERCSGFFALGLAKASGRAVAVTCTSGTAAANLAPAVIEADEARVPLIVLTADRPPELRGVGAGQTIDQIKLYGDAVRWFVEVGNHEATAARLRWIRGLACRAFWTAHGDRPGPVHLNWPLREPLVLDGPLPRPAVGGRADGRPWIRRSGSPDLSSSGFAPADSVSAYLGSEDSGSRGRSSRAAEVELDLEAGLRGLVVAGGAAGSLAPEIPDFAQRAGYPLLADPLSGARSGPAAVAHYDALLRRPGRFERPELVIRVGDLPTSKPLRTWLAGLVGVRQLTIDPHGGWQDPDGVVCESIQGDPRSLLAGAAPGPAPPDWLEQWRTADRLAAGALEGLLAGELTEPAVARALGTWLGPEDTVFVAASMPIRDVESFWPVRVDGPRVLANRGANGIDGTVSSAFGAAAAGSGQVVLLIGDVALAHDIGGLLAAGRLGLKLTVVLLDNGGGGIFDFLPVSGERDIFEQHVATPTGLDFSRAAALYGLEHDRPETLAALRASIERALAGPASTVIEVRGDRAANVALHARAVAAVTSALGED
jgi:2-succinyl-5-enolpyruvyl-6-hydroxy-3-cyclohexene-1-carboxylate synthase